MITKTGKVWLGGAGGITRPLTISQYDTGWTFALNVYDGSTLYNPAEAVAVTLEGDKPDGTAFAIPGTFSAGVATFAIPADVSAVSGTVACELRVSMGDETVGTANFDIIVEAAPLAQHVTSEDNFAAMQALLDEVGQDAASAAQSAATAESAAGTAAQTVLDQTPAMVDAWLEDNIDPESGYALDRSLQVPNAAAPADLVGDLKSAINVLSFNISEYYESGGLTSTGNGTTDARRIRFKTWHKYPFDIVIQPLDGYKISYVEIINNEPVAYSFSTNIAIVKSGIDFRLAIGKVSDATDITSADAVNVKIITNTEYNYIGFEQKYNIDFILGNIVNGAVTTNVNYRYVNKNIIYFLDDVVIYTDQIDVRFAVQKYGDVNGTTYDTSDNGWKYGSVVIPAMTPFRILVSRLVNTPISDLFTDSAFHQLHIISKSQYTTSPDKTLKLVDHRGYDSIAPENTIPAFALSKRMGFNWIETDVSWTSDNIPVILHDENISRTSDGTGKITEMTYTDASQYDFGSWKNAIYKGTKIPKAEEMLNFCRTHNIGVFLEIKFGATQERINALIALVKKCGMFNNVYFIASGSPLSWLRSSSANNLGVCVNAEPTSSNISYVAPFKNFTNRIMFAMPNANITSEYVDTLINNEYDLLSDILSTTFDSTNDYASWIITDSMPPVNKI